MNECDRSEVYTSLLKQYHASITAAVMFSTAAIVSGVVDFYIPLAVVPFSVLVFSIVAIRAIHKTSQFCGCTFVKAWRQLSDGNPFSYRYRWHLCLLSGALAALYIVINRIVDSLV